MKTNNGNKCQSKVLIRIFTMLPELSAQKQALMHCGVAAAAITATNDDVDVIQHCFYELRQTVRALA